MDDFFVDNDDQVHLLSEITPAMVTALDSYDDRGELSGSVVTLRRLIRLDLAKPRGFSVRITELGHRVIAKLTDAGWFDVPTHRVRYSHGSVPVSGTGRTTSRGWVESESLLFSAWCSCGDFVHYGTTEQERRWAVRRHKQECGVL